MGRYFNKAKAKAWELRRKGIETRLITPASDNDYIVDLRKYSKRRVVRDPFVSAKAKQGKEFCEHCRWTPPTPSILHAHHVIPIACEGPDTIENIIVLCPNCHAVAHYVAPRTNLTRTYIGPRTPQELRTWMWAIKDPKQLRLLQQANARANAAPMLAAMRA